MDDATCRQFLQHFVISKCSPGLQLGNVDFSCSYQPIVFLNGWLVFFMPLFAVNSLVQARSWHNKCIISVLVVQPEQII